MAETQLKLASAKKREQLVYETEKSRGKFGFRPAELWYPNNIPGTSLSLMLYFMLALFPGKLFPRHGKWSPSAPGLHGPNLPSLWKESQIWNMLSPPQSHWRGGIQRGKHSILSEFQGWEGVDP